MSPLTPTTFSDVQDAVRSHDRIYLRGGGSKPALTPAPSNGAALLDLSGLAGITEYDPGEYTFTARAGTPIADVAAALAENGQYLPFDPLLIEAGATLGGTVAANTAGPGRYRYGGVRDFLVGIRFVGPGGELVRGGGRVVKNASGFDLPKFFVGSLGRYGVLVETSFKVFPRPRAAVTVCARYDDLGDLQAASYALAPSPLEMDAQDWEPQPDGRWALVMRLAGLPEALPARVERLQQFLRAHSRPGDFETLDEAADAAFWAAVNRCEWAPAAGVLVKVPLSPRQVPRLESELAAAGRAILPERRYTAAGNAAWLSATDVPILAATLHDQKLTGLVLRGAAPAEPIIGRRPALTLAERVKKALDPLNKFGPP